MVLNTPKVPVSVVHYACSKLYRTYPRAPVVYTTSEVFRTLPIAMLPCVNKGHIMVKTRIFSVSSSLCNYFNLDLPSIALVSAEDADDVLIVSTDSSLLVLVKINLCHKSLWEVLCILHQRIQAPCIVSDLRNLAGASPRFDSGSRCRKWIARDR